jgi:hypothetical protein
VRKLVLVVGLTASVIGLTNTASALDTYYSAAGCGFSIPTQGVTARGGGASNSGTAVNSVTCPVVLHGYGNRYYEVTVNRAPRSAPMTCYRTSQFGSSVTTVTYPVNVTGTDTKVYMSSAGYPNAESIGCALPGPVGATQSFVRRYYVDEY